MSVRRPAPAAPATELSLGNSPGEGGIVTKLFANLGLGNEPDTAGPKEAKPGDPDYTSPFLKKIKKTNPGMYRGRPNDKRGKKEYYEPRNIPKDYRPMQLDVLPGDQTVGPDDYVEGQRLPRNPYGEDRRRLPDAERDGRNALFGNEEYRNLYLVDPNDADSRELFDRLQSTDQEREAQPDENEQQA